MPFIPIADACAQRPTELRFDRTGFVQVGADSLYFESVGNGPTVVLLHDGLVHRAIWDLQVPALSKVFRVVRYDRRGYGKSSAPTEAYSGVEDLRKLLDHLGIERAALVAMSSGGRLAIDFTLQNPEMVTALVLVGAVVSGFPYTQHFYDRGGHLPSGLSFEARRLYYTSDDPYEIAPENLEAKARVRALVQATPMEHGHGQAARSERPAAERLGEISVPTLILVGEFDIPDVHAHAGAINLGIRHSTREIVRGAGHLIPVEQPDVFTRRALAFLSGQSP